MSSGEGKEGKRFEKSESPTAGGEDESSSNESEFQNALSKSTKSSQLKLFSDSRKYQGRLASRMLRRCPRQRRRVSTGRRCCNPLFRANWVCAPCPGSMPRLASPGPPWETHGNSAQFLELFNFRELDPFSNETKNSTWPKST